MYVLVNVNLVIKGVCPFTVCTCVGVDDNKKTVSSPPHTLQAITMSCTQCPTTQALCTLVTTQPGANTTPIANGTRTTTASKCLGTQVCTCQLLQEHHILDGMTR